MNLYDYIYVDLEKVVSLYSQLTGGVIEVRETNQETTSGTNKNTGLDFKFFNYESGKSEDQAESQKFTIKPHHAVLKELEQELFNQNHVIDLSESEGDILLKDPKIRERIKNSLCIKCSGRIVIEDYDRIKLIAQDFPDIVELINKSQEEAIRQSDEYQQLLTEIKNLESTKTKDRDLKAKNKLAAKSMRKRLEEEITQARSVEGVEQWILDGMQTWINSFLPGIINIRLYPNTDEIDEHVFGHLNPNGFTIKDKSAFHFNYGSFPTEEFTLLGIVTAVPPEKPDDFDPLAEFKKEKLDDTESVEKAFRGVFRGFDGFEAIIRTIRYPRILVHPLLVYREATPNKSI